MNYRELLCLLLRAFFVDSYDELCWSYKEDVSIEEMLSFTMTDAEKRLMTPKEVARRFRHLKDKYESE
jgi:hypothetical protein